jgi:hypothetical protein
LNSDGFILGTKLMSSNFEGLAITRGVVWCDYKLVSVVGIEGVIFTSGCRVCHQQLNHFWASICLMGSSCAKKARAHCQQGLIVLSQADSWVWYQVTEDCQGSFWEIS